MNNSTPFAYHVQQVQELLETYAPSKSKSQTPKGKKRQTPEERASAQQAARVRDEYLAICKDALLRFMRDAGHAIYEGDAEQAASAAFDAGWAFCELQTVAMNGQTSQELGSGMREYRQKQAEKASGSDVTAAMLGAVDDLHDRHSLSWTAAAKRVAANGDLNPLKLGWQTIYKQSQKQRF